MELHVSYEEGYVLASTIGPIDDSAGALFREYLYPVIGQHGTKLVLDMSRSERINSVGLGQMVMLIANANIHGSHVVLAACAPFVGQVFKRAKLNQFFAVADSLPEAIGRLLDQ
jgi:anti-anti-sigma factor